MGQRNSTVDHCCRETIELDELEAAVQWSLDDERDNFEEFLEDECGSFVRFVPGSKDDQVVQLNHETFRSFLLDPMKCPEEFFIDDEIVHGYVAVQCMQCLSTENRLHIVNQYAAKNWIRHLSKATSKEVGLDVLGGLYQLFKSDGIRVWIRAGLLEIWERTDATIGYRC